MADYIVINSTQAALSNVNAGGDDVPAESQMVCTLTDTELGVVASTAGVGVVKSTADYQTRRAIARTLKYEKVQ